MDSSERFAERTVPLSLLERIEPTLGAEEESYRLHYLQSDTARAKVGAILVVLLVLLVFSFEMVTLPRQIVASVAFARVAFVGVAAVIFATARRRTTPAALDRASLVFTLAFTAQYIFLFTVRPPSRVDEIGNIIVILGCYLLSPAPIQYRAAAPVALNIGVVAVLAFVRGAEFGPLWSNAIVLVAANALGFWGSAQMHTQRRREFQSQERLRLSLQERDALIDRLRQSNKMESMGRIVGGVAHDFNNILGSMFAAVEFLLADIPAASPSRADAESLRASVKRGADLTKQLLAFSRQQVLEPKVVDLNGLVLDTERMLSRTIGEHIAINVALGTDLASVRVDPGQIQQILLNLAVNARDAMPAGGSLQIRTRSVTLGEPTVMSHSVAPAGQYVVLNVQDTGTGMDPSIVAKIFEPFFTTKPKGKGTGLGLSTVFGIVEQSGGHIRVSSRIGQGTTFEIFFPSTSDHPSPVTPEPEAPPVSRGTETILLAEDDDDLRSLLGRVLSLKGYHVLQARDGVDALRVAAGHSGPVHLLASDVVMPNMGGQRLAEELAAVRPDTKVLFMSGYTDDAFTDGKLSAGAAFLQKPVDPSLLLMRIRSMLD